MGRGQGGQDKREGDGGPEIFVKFNKRGGSNKQGDWNFKKSVNIGNQWKKRHKCLILMLNFKVSKQARSEASQNKVKIKRVNINELTN